MNIIHRLYHQSSLAKGCICILLLLFVIQIETRAENGPSFADQADKPYLVKEFDIDGAGVLKAFTLAGNIEVRSVPQSNRVRVELYIERGYAFWSDSRNLDNYRINILQRGNEIIASVEQKKKSTGFFSDKMRFSYKIYVPEAMSTELKTLGGHISLSGVRGDQLVKTGGGNLTLNNLSGRIGAYTSGGTIDITRNRGTIYAQTEGGNIHTEYSKGELRLKTAGGDITSQHTSGSFIARTEAGNIRAQFMEVSEGINMETMAGNIFVEIPARMGFNIIAAGSRIDFSEAENFFGELTPRKAEGRIHEGGTPLQLQTSSGTITVKTK